MPLGAHRITVSGYPGRMTFATAHVLRAIRRLHKPQWHAYLLMEQLEDFNQGTVNKVVHRLEKYGIIARADSDEYRKSYKLTVAGYKLLEDEQLVAYMASLSGPPPREPDIAPGKELPISWTLLEVLSALDRAKGPQSCWQLAEGQSFSVGVALRVTRQLEVQGFVDAVSDRTDSGRSKKYFSISVSGER